MFAALATTATRILRSIRPAAHVCDPWRLDEVAMSDCRYGCKVVRCSDCGGEQVAHRRSYGCPAPIAA